VENLLDNPENIKPGGELREISILMADLRGFSSTAEILNPELTLQLLNLFIEKMTDVIQKYEGTINEVLGDALLVLFGAPFYKEDHADRAIACAIEMQNQIDPLNDLLRVMQLPPVRMGIGINSGEVIVGNIGSRKRLKYGVVGRNVNLTARIESYTVGYQILISEQTFHNVSSELTVEKVIKVNPKGVKQPVHLFDVTGINGIFDVELHLPDRSLKILKSPLKITFEVLDDSETIKKEKYGEIANISSFEAELITTEQFRVYSNLKLKMTSKCGAQIVETVHAKVINKISNGYVIVFTSHFSMLNKFIEACST
jgi:adenylate cyclase